VQSERVELTGAVSWMVATCGWRSSETVEMLVTVYKISVRQEE
jgi:hypothetical protein